jgi:tetratricopeptide (TPR) repeat protein
MSDAADTPGGPNLEAALHAMDAQARAAPDPAQKARIFNRMGDIAFDIGDRDGALAHYGRAIDHYLIADRHDSAAALCRKVLRIAPDVVRARCTLAWIAIGKGVVEDARREVAAYASAAEAAGRQEMAREHIRRMGDIPDVELRQALAETLLDLGDDAGADRLFRRVFGAHTEDELLDGEGGGERWQHVRQAAVTPKQD